MVRPRPRQNGLGGERPRRLVHLRRRRGAPLFLEKNDLDLIVRAHQVVKDGYEFFADRGLVTVFSAPNYCSEFDNCGAMMSVDENLQCNRLEWPTVGQQPVGYAAAQAEDVTAASNPTLRVLHCTSSESAACTCLHACAALGPAR
eukprot:scaffold116082_cov79-Phaeocystis_antarctica.AAC.2